MEERLGEEGGDHSYIRSLAGFESLGESALALSPEMGLEVDSAEVTWLVSGV
jgi:hypothetical protein